MLCTLINNLEKVFGIVTKPMSDLELLDTLFSTRRKESAYSRCSGNVTSVIQNFCSGPEILDQFFTSYRNAVHAHKQFIEGV
jgi:hypothetical protein